MKKLIVFSALLSMSAGVTMASSSESFAGPDKALTAVVHYNSYLRSINQVYDGLDHGELDLVDEKGHATTRAKAILGSLQDILLYLIESSAPSGTKFISKRRSELKFERTSPQQMASSSESFAGPDKALTAVVHYNTYLRSINYVDDGLDRGELDLVDEKGHATTRAKAILGSLQDILLYLIESSAPSGTKFISKRRSELKFERTSPQQ